MKKIIKRTIWILMFLFLVEGAIAVNNVYVNPANQTVDNSFEISIDINATDKIFSADITLLFNKSILNGFSIIEGDFLKKDGAATSIATSDIDNANGEISFAITRYENQTGVNGTGTICKIVFSLKNKGDSFLNLDAELIEASYSPPVSVPSTTINGSVTVISQLYNLTLTDGWNLFSLPIRPVENVSIDPLYSYVDGSYKKLDNVAGFIGFWTNTTGDIVIEGIGINNTIFNLKKDWNLINYPSSTENNISYVLGNVSDDYSAVFAYENNEWKSFNPHRAYALNTLDKMKPGLGYWIKLNDDVEWWFDGAFRKN
ncbi:MAG: hypothetical protein KAU20_07490 [Nanoarchaeota archaeon]|nr:hypothetical protein [Nanoarchaeota archaeon]